MSTGIRTQNRKCYAIARRANGSKRCNRHISAVYRGLKQFEPAFDAEGWPAPSGGFYPTRFSYISNSNAPNYLSQTALYSHSISWIIRRNLFPLWTFAILIPLMIFHWYSITRAKLICAGRYERPPWCIFKLKRGLTVENKYKRKISNMQVRDHCPPRHSRR